MRGYLSSVDFSIHILGWSETFFIDCYHALQPLRSVSVRPFHPGIMHPWPLLGCSAGINFTLQQLENTVAAAFFCKRKTLLRLEKKKSWPASRLWPAEHGIISPGSDCLAGFLKLAHTSSDCLAGFLKLAHTSERNAPQPNVLISWFLLMFIFVHTLESTSLAWTTHYHSRIVKQDECRLQLTNMIHDDHRSLCVLCWEVFLEFIKQWKI